MNGKRYGYGREYKSYYYDNKNFEGEFKDGEKNGYGIEYNKNKRSIIEREFKDDKRWNGIGKENYYNDKLKKNYHF